MFRITNNLERIPNGILNNVIVSYNSNDKIHKQQQIKKIPNSSRVMVPTQMWR